MYAIGPNHRNLHDKKSHKMMKRDFLITGGTHFKQLSENSDGFGRGGLPHSPAPISTPLPKNRQNQPKHKSTSRIFLKIAENRRQGRRKNGETPPRSAAKLLSPAANPPLHYERKEGWVAAFGKAEPWFSSAASLHYS